MIINEDPDHPMEEQVVVEHSFSQPFIINQMDAGESHGSSLGSTSGRRMYPCLLGNVPDVLLLSDLCSMSKSVQRKI